jgi:hypothetical protein
MTCLVFCGVIAAGFREETLHSRAPGSTADKACMCISLLAVAVLASKIRLRHRRGGGAVKATLAAEQLELWNERGTRNAVSRC